MQININQYWYNNDNWQWELHAHHTNNMLLLFDMLSLKFTMPLNKNIIV